MALGRSLRRLLGSAHPQSFQGSSGLVHLRSLHGRVAGDAFCPLV
jgi:hypothetical protein